MAMRKKIDYQSANSVERLFSRLPQRTIRTLSRKIHARARSRAYRLTYVNEKEKTEVITLTLRPRLVDRKKRDAVWRTVRILDKAFQKIAGLVFKIPGLTELFPFSPRELDWLSVMERPDYRPGRIASRWDANTAFDSADWKKGFSFFETNGVGVGGIWYGPACAELTLQTVVPELAAIDPHFRPALGHDMRRLLLWLLLEERKKIGRRRNRMAFVMEKASGSNFVEFEQLVKSYTQLGFPSLVVEPTDFVLKKGEIFARGEKIDIL